MLTLKEILKSLFVSAPSKPVEKREQINGFEFLVKLEDRVKDKEIKTTCVFISTEHPDSVYLTLQTYLHSNDGRQPQDSISKLGGKRIGLVLSADYETAKKLLDKFENEYKQIIGNLKYTLSDYSYSKNFKEFLIKAQTEK
ncbi:MAG: hypothetical protein AABX39_05925 [Nanoarchaeota archaeon]